MMGRISRKNMTHAFNHVMVRGNNKQRIFHHHDDFQHFVSLLEKSLTKYHCEVHLFCLMSNHVHLLIKTHEIPLSRIMAVLLGNYSKYFSHRYEFIGHLFQRRFLAKYVCHRDYFLELLFYIHANPLKANLVDRLENYLWSSHNNYINRASFPWVNTNYLKNLLQRYKKMEYQSYIEKKLMTDNSSTIFCDLDEDGALTLEVKNMDVDSNAESLNLSYFDFLTIAKVVCNVKQVEFEELSGVSQAHDLSITRAVIAYFAHFMGHIPLKYIAIYFERHVTSVSNGMYRNIKNQEFIALRKKCYAEFKKLIADKILND